MTRDEHGPQQGAEATTTAPASFDGGGLPISALVADSVVRVPPGATLREAAQALAGGDVGAVAIGDGDAIEAVVSERDVARAVADGRDPDATPAIEYGSSHLVWLEADATVAEAARHMMQEWVRHAFVRDGDRLAGIVSARDLLGVFATDVELPDDRA